jgi:hypothetical protein
MMQPKAEKPRDQLQERASRLRDLATTGIGAEPFQLFIEMLRIAEAEAKERLVEADPEIFQLLQGEAQAIRKLLKILTQPKRLVQTGKVNV